ncbi:MAG: hypothetical protein RSG92_24380 [Pseudomonas sp.]
MANYLNDYIRLCYECSSDRRTVGNMLSLVIPEVQRRACEIRKALDLFPRVFLCWQDLERDAIELEQAAVSGLVRCQFQPEQQQLFAA